MGGFRVGVFWGFVGVWISRHRKFDLGLSRGCRYGFRAFRGCRIHALGCEAGFRV